MLLQSQPLPLTTPMDPSNTPTVSSAPVTPIAEEPCPINLTPPSTPVRPKVLRVTSSSESGHLGQDAQSATGPSANDATVDSNTSMPTTEERLCWEKTIPRPCTKKYQLQDSALSGGQELGRGAWSTVYRATERLQSQPSPLPTPPTSPVSSPNKPATGRLLAVKTAARRDAHDVLYREARVLTYLHSSTHASRYLVPFHGYDTSSQSLVMDAVPLNLDAFARSCLKTARLNFSTRTMFDPACGVQEWQSLATQLIDGLAFLHGKSCVHGDIKPANILLRPDSAGSCHKYTALYCDFSSSSILDSQEGHSKEPAQHLTALTPDFASPELFTSLHSTAAAATTASDVYALGVTLVVAAIGTSPYAGASTEIQKLSMAREGRVLDFARQSEQATRVMKEKTVDRCLKHALEKNPEKRSTIMEWKRDVDAIFDGLS
ncbi:MAG: hypothetical protein Q9225_002346 [Loekoesia sp. 1 TL-2023]